VPLVAEKRTGFQPLRFGGSLRGIVLSGAVQRSTLRMAYPGEVVSLPGI
jgi:hypothetical protein